MQSNFAIAVHAELLRARTLHPDRQPSLHHGYAVLMEEVKEFEAEVFKKSEDRDPDRLFAELIQVAACAQRVAEDVVLRGKLES